MLAIMIQARALFGQARPMLEQQIQARYGRRPATHLADAGYCRHADIEWAAAQARWR